MSFAYLQEQLFPLGNLPCRWHISGGWAIDLFLGRQTREHKDIDISLARQDQLLLQKSFPRSNFTCIENGMPRAWEPGEFLNLPIHEIWVRGTGYELEFLLDEVAEDIWVSRRDQSIRLPFSEAVLESAATGIRFAAPHIALYFKAKKARPKDTADFLACRPYMSKPQLDWLLAHIGPDHAWGRAA